MGVLSLGFSNGAMATSSVTTGSRQEMSRLRFCFENLVAECGLSPYNPGHDPWTFPNDDPAKAAEIAAALADFTRFHPDADRAKPLGNPGKINGADLITEQIQNVAPLSRLLGSGALPPPHWLRRSKSNRRQTRVLPEACNRQSS